MAGPGNPCAVIFGAGVPAGIGGATALRLAQEGLPVYVTGLHQDKLASTVKAIEQRGGAVTALTVDATDEEQVKSVFERVEHDGRVPEFVLHNVGVMQPKNFLDMTPEFLEKLWRAGCLSGFIVGQAAIRAMLPQGAGTLLFTGASASLRGKAGVAAFAAAKSGLRIYAQAMAREFGPKGIHVAHVIVDGVVNGERGRQAMPQVLEKLGDEGTIDPNAVADAYWDLHLQHRTAWSHEIELRPFREDW